MPFTSRFQAEFLQTTIGTSSYYIGSYADDTSTQSLTKEKRMRSKEDLALIARYMRRKMYYCGNSGWVERLLGRPALNHEPWVKLSCDKEERRTIFRYHQACAEYGALYRRLGKARDLVDVYRMVGQLLELGPVVGRPHQFLTERLAFLRSADPGGVVWEFYKIAFTERYIPPWSRTAWWKNSSASLLHCIRPSTDHPGQLSYFPSAEKFARGTRVAVRPGRYLAKYFGTGTLTGLSDVTIRAYSADFVNAVNGHTLFMTEPTTKDNRDEVAAQWLRIYAEGPGSCMRGNDAVRIYAYPGNTLRLAFFTDTEKPEGIPIARCIVRDDKMAWIRIYPDDQGPLWRDMVNKLGARGYSRGNLNGVKLRLIRENDDIVCPYIDMGEGGFQSVNVNDRHLVCGGEEHDAVQTSGYLGLVDHSSCCECDRTINEDESYFYHDNGPYCGDCYGEHYRYAIDRHSGGDYPRDECVHCESNDEWYFEEDAHHHNIYECAASGRWYHIDDLRVTSAGYVHHSRAVKLDIADGEGCTYARAAHSYLTHDGRTIHQDDVYYVEWHDGLTYALHVDDDPADYLPPRDDVHEEGEGEEGEGNTPVAINVKIAPSELEPEEVNL